MAYPSQAEKGRAFSVFWGISSCGALVSPTQCPERHAEVIQIGGLIALGIDIASGSVSKTATGTYVAFFTIIMIGVFLSLSLLPPERIVRKDGTTVAAYVYASPKEELGRLWAAMKQPIIILLLPMFFASNYFCKGHLPRRELN